MLIVYGESRKIPYIQNKTKKGLFFNYLFRSKFCFSMQKIQIFRRERCLNNRPPLFFHYCYLEYQLFRIRNISYCMSAFVYFCILCMCNMTRAIEITSVMYKNLMCKFIIMLLRVVYYRRRYIKYFFFILKVCSFYTK